MAVTLAHQKKISSGQGEERLIDNVQIWGSFLLTLSKSYFFRSFYASLVYSKNKENIQNGCQGKHLGKKNLYIKILIGIKFLHYCLFYLP